MYRNYVTYATYRYRHFDIENLLLYLKSKISLKPHECTKNKNTHNYYQVVK